jgi:hypothetical protein
VNKVTNLQLPWQVGTVLIGRVAINYSRKIPAQGQFVSLKNYEVTEIQLFE